MAKERNKDKYYANQFGNVFGQMVGTPVGRLVFCNLKTPNAKYQPPKYGTTILFDKKDPATKAALNIMLKQCVEMQTYAEEKEVDCSFDIDPLQDGDDTKVSKYQGFAGSLYIAAKNKDQPEFVDSKNKPVSADLLVPGVKVRAVVTPMIYSDGFTWKLHVVQFVEDDGVRFYGGPDPKSVLTALDEVAVEDEPSVEAALDKAIEPQVAAQVKETKKGKARAIEML